jgi:hypothetical protein
MADDSAASKGERPVASKGGQLAVTTVALRAVQMAVPKAAWALMMVASKGLH